MIIKHILDTETKFDPQTQLQSHPAKNKGAASS